MKAMRFHEFGAPEVLQYEDVEQPTPGEGQTLVAVTASAFNPADNSIRAGNLKAIPIALPHIPGYDVAGTVGGRPVIGFLPMDADGAAAEYVAAPASALVDAPSSIDLADAAGLPSVALTAYQGLFDHAGLTAGQRILITGAGGTVGHYAVQLAARAGAHVIATASPSSRDAVAAAGAAEVIDHTTTDVVSAVGEQVDVVYNLAPSSPEEMAAYLGLVRDGGAIVTTTAWLPAPSDEARGVRGITEFVRSDAAQLTQLVELIDAGELTLAPTRRVALADLASVHAEAAAGTLRGKVVVLP
ncbi:NADP-dependent oxidoreductase [Cnuibacter sp. UC19_7]|uniref:NADP-dependent oxidoreductase n=1 Tax=Cnuibacter sp. UC19_7 TaxID=3350166 RepID=UPI0036728492